MRRQTIGKLSPQGDNLRDLTILNGANRIRHSASGSVQVRFTVGFGAYRSGDVAGLTQEAADYMVDVLEVGVKV